MNETPEQRSRIMRAVKGTDTAPELAVRRLVHGMGYRFRVHRKDLPGRPDITFPKFRSIILVHGCFWHGHGCRRGARVPKTNIEYWMQKVSRNRARDTRTLVTLRDLGWRVLTIWECQLKNQDDVRHRIESFLARAREEN